MRWNYYKPAGGRGVTRAWAIAAGTVMLAGTIGLATPALAAPAGTHALGSFKTWRGAQRAAGFKLLRPTKTYGHVRNGDISVARCEVKGKAAKRLVTATYGLTPFSVLSISQNNSGGPCMSLGKVKRLGTVKVNGTKGVLSGKCGMRGLRACTSRKIFLFLTWVKHGKYYVAGSFGLRRKTLAGFANGLRPVG